MPKTHTDDTGAAIPPVLIGPLQILDPTDPSSWVKIDPGAAKIGASGDARPARVLTTGYVRTYGTTTSQIIGTYMTARYIGAGNNGGFHAAGIHIPADMDAAAPSVVRLLVATATDSQTDGLKVQFGVHCSAFTQAGSLTNTLVSYDWDVPDGWTMSEYKVVTIDNGNGHTYDANTFANGDIVGIRVSRQGSAAQDTYDKAVKIAEYLQFEYSAKEY